MSKSLDKTVWDALGFGDRWFPPDVPTQGPDWCIAVKTIPSLNPNKPDWILLESFPPVSRDWNLAMWTLEKSANGERFCAQYDVKEGIDEVTGWTSYIGDGWYADVQDSGPVAVCKAILGHEQWKKARKKTDD